MSDEAKVNTAKRKRWTWIVAVAVGLPVAYVFSIGPSAWMLSVLIKRFPHPWLITAFMLFYAPLELLANSLGLSGLVKWYVGLFLPGGIPD